MLESRARAERGHRSYRDVVADGQAQLAVVERCPNCGTHFNATDAPVLPAGLPDRDEEARAARRRRLEPTARRLAEQLRPRLTEPGSFAIWLAPLVLDDATSDTLFLACQPELAQLTAWISGRYGPLLEWAAEVLAGRRMRVAIYPSDRAGAATLGELVTADADAGAVAA